MQFLKKSLCLMLVMAVAVSVSADEAKEKKKKGEKKAPSPTAKFVQKLELTDAQKEQVAAIDKEFAPKVAEFVKARQELLTDEQKTAEKDARKAAKDAGKTGPEARKAVEEALKLTDEQKTKMKEIGKQEGEVNGKIIEALKKFLTPEQIEKLPKTGGKKDGEKKKKDAA
jgi:Spy/CpxP family protein refolding chaperone